MRPMGAHQKWLKLLKDRPDVAAELHVEGDKCLAAFGYEPPQEDVMESFPSTTRFQCDDTVVCAEKG